MVGIFLAPSDLRVPHGSGRRNAEENCKRGPEDDSEVFGVASCGDATTGEDDDKEFGDRGLTRENREGELSGVRRVEVCEILRLGIGVMIGLDALI